jgi:YD repeat-containing protein
MFFDASPGRWLVALSFALVASLFVKSGTTAAFVEQHSAESADAASTRENAAESDRENAGLKGPVQTCTEETIYPPRGPADHAFRIADTNTYYADGNAYQHTDYNGTESFTYDAQRRLLAEVWEGSDAREIIHTYDTQGRLISITGEHDPPRTTTFEYDDQGRKTRIVKSDLKVSPSSITYIHGPYDADLSVIPPDGGLVKTLFNRRDQAIESQIYDANGNLRRRLLHVYDTKARVAEYLVVDSKTESFLVQKTRERLTEPATASDDTMGEVTNRISYVYDDKDRIVEKRDFEGFSQITITTITYNDHGDKTEEIATTRGYLDQPGEPEGENEDSPSSNALDSPSMMPAPQIVRFSYQYDSFGNWIEQTVSSPASAHDSGVTLSITHRTIAYF